MRLADVQLSFPPILVALLIDGIARNALPKDVHQDLAVPDPRRGHRHGELGPVRPDRSRLDHGEKNKDYVHAARLVGLSRRRGSCSATSCPTCSGPVLVLGTLGFGLAILTEATLSFLGLGVPATRPSLGTFIRIGNEVLFSDEWWMLIFPGVVLVIMVLAVNLLGDWLRDALNPKLR